MALAFLLDTNVVSEWVKPQPHPAVLKALKRHAASCAIGAPTLEELAYGCARLDSDTRREALRRWIDGIAQRIPVLPYDARAADWLGQERARLARIGKPAPRTDGEIAAIAWANGLTLVTRNLADFAAFEGLKVINWHQPAGAARKSS